MAEDPIMASIEPTKPQQRRRRFLITSFIITLICLVVLILTLVFKVREPTIILNNISLSSGSAGLVLASGSNVSMIVDVSVKNPNSASFKFTNTTSSIYYKGVLVGGGNGPGGRARAHRTLRMNISMAIAMDRVFEAPDMASDMGLGLFTMNSHTIAPGRVKMLMLKRDAMVELNCTVSFNITTEQIQGQKCKRHVYLKI